MNQDQLMEVVRKGESETVEFKESFDKETIETVGAFANTNGGSIFIGVSDKGKVNSVQTGKETLNSWANRISQSTDPRVIPDIDNARAYFNSISKGLKRETKKTYYQFMLKQSKKTYDTFYVIIKNF